MSGIGARGRNEMYTIKNKPSFFLEDVNLYFPPVASSTNKTFTFGRCEHDKGTNAKKFYLAF